MGYKHYLFDWGDTLMVDEPGNPRPMCDWEQVSAVPGARELLAYLHGKAGCHLATNSDSTDEQQIRKALLRAGLSEYIQNIYCYKTLGMKKPSRRFYAHILADLGVPGADVLMVGDGLEKDVFGALNSGIEAVWFNPDGAPVPANVRAIERLFELTGVD